MIEGMQLSCDDDRNRCGVCGNLSTSPSHFGGEDDEIDPDLFWRNVVKISHIHVRDLDGTWRSITVQEIDKEPTDV